MGALSKTLRNCQGGILLFWCPGCETAHQVRVDASHGTAWTWNGDAERPTFSPSVLVRSGHHVPGQEGKDCWCTFEQRTGQKLPAGTSCRVCHSFVRDGRIEFLQDCTHALAGQTVDIPPWPADFHDGDA